MEIGLDSDNYHLMFCTCRGLSVNWKHPQGGNVSKSFEERGVHSHEGDPELN